MTKVFAALVLAITTSGVTLAQQTAPAQARPDYSGSWTLVEDRSTASNSRAFGTNFKVSQTATNVTIETTATIVSGTVSSAGAGAPMTTERKEIKLPTDYICDGAEHELVRQIPGMSAADVPPGAIFSAPAPTTYRATWTSGQLIIITQTYAMQSGQKPEVRSVARAALSFDADGSLIVDNLTIQMIPRPNGPKQEPPVPVRSIYKKTP